MGKFGKQELGLDKYDKVRTAIEIGRALERCVDVDEDYVDFLVLFINYAQQKEAGVAAYGGEKPSSDVEEDDPDYMTFLANTKPHGGSYVFQATDQNGLPVLVEYEKDRESEIHRVEKGQGNELVRKNRIVEKQKMKDGSFLRKKPRYNERDLDDRTRRFDVKIVSGNEQKIKDGILSEKRRNEDRDLDDRLQRVDVKIVPDKEQKIQNNSKFMDVEVKIEEDSVALEEAVAESEVEILENVSAELGRGSSFNPFVPAVQHLDATIRDSGYRKECLNLLMRPYDEEEYTKLWKDIKMQLPSSSTNERGKSLLSLHKALEEAISESEVEILENVGAELGRGSSFNPFVPSVQHLDATIRDSGYRKECLNLLMRPYDEEEYKKLWKDIKVQLPSSSTNKRRESLLSRHKAVNRAIKRTNHDKDKKLNIMRGFFFWLEHLTRQDAFQPWKDAECLQTMPGSS
ncbi:uncharacterized protein LOC107852490 isoform X1 [Capsicum annuum]|uniref:uncharacterized protein LOC107852490 isoform X1 n=1 Tax=Capsicum annuum TaxID=4072 RepID=UPI001FB0A3A8|nr:uncharacterized protein LOC107852490 isoform X1 [Capsicum annuum]